MSTFPTSTIATAQPFPLPLVSIITPMYNASKTIYKTLLSILTQDYTGPIEICLFNDCSTDSTEERLISFINDHLLLFPQHQPVDNSSLSSLSSFSTSSSSSSSSIPSPPPLVELDRTTLESYTVTTVSGTFYSLPSSLFRRTTVGGGTVSLKYQTGYQLHTKVSHGPAFGRNRAVSFSTGTYLCLLDADDQMLPSRITWQYEEALKPLQTTESDRITQYLAPLTTSFVSSSSSDPLSSSVSSSSSMLSSSSSSLVATVQSSSPYVLVGGYFVRDPPESMRWYTEWANNFANHEDTYINGWRECSMIQPTWFMHRNVYESIGGYDEIIPKYLIDQYIKNSRTGSSLVANNGTTPGDDNEIRKNQDGTNTVTATALTATPSVTAVSFTKHTNYPIDNVVSTRQLHWQNLQDLPSNYTEETSSLSSFFSSSTSSSLSSVLPTINNAIIEQGICSWLPSEKAYRHPPLLSRAPVKLHPLNIDEHTFRQFAFGEDPIFWHRHLSRGGLLRIVRRPLIIYHYNPSSLSFSTAQATLLRVRTALFEERLLASRFLRIKETRTENTTRDASLSLPSQISLSSTNGTLGSNSTITEYILPPLWQSFSIWNAGRDGKSFYNSLSPHGKCQVVQFFDIDPKKVGQYYPQIMGQSKKVTKAAIRAKNEINTEKEIGKYTDGNTVSSKRLPLKRTYYQTLEDGDGETYSLNESIRSTADVTNGTVPNINSTDSSADESLLSTRMHNLTHPILSLKDTNPAMLPLVCCVSFKNGGTDLENNIKDICGKTGAIMGESLLFMT